MPASSGKAIAALPMYDWPEAVAETDAEWSRLRERLRAARIAAPPRLVRRNADMPPVVSGIRDSAGKLLAPDPGSLPPAGLDLHTLWLHPHTLLAQTCWGPLELGLSAHVTIIGQPDYSAYEGGAGELYSSVILARSEAGATRRAPSGQQPSLPPADWLKGRRFAYNGADSMSGFIAVSRDLAEQDATMDIFSERIVSGSHRGSVRAVAAGSADICAVDCRSWSLIQRFEPAAQGVLPVGWTGLRKGLPYIVSNALAHLYRDAGWIS